MCKCEKCGKEYRYEWAYEKHVKKCKYGEPKKYECKICGKEFDKPGAVGGHMACEHGKVNKKEKFECPICHEILFTNKGAFSNHIKNHDADFANNRSQKIKEGWNKLLQNESKKQELSKIRSEFMKENNPMFKKENIDKMTKSINERIASLSNEEYSKMVINFINAPKKGNAANHSGKYTPTKPEQIIIDMNIKGLIYNGNKKDSKTIRLKNKNYKHSITPDFIYEGTNKFIEVFGVYWHPKEDEEKYINAYKENNYNVLIIWELELYNNLHDTKLKILNFLNSKSENLF